MTVKKASLYTKKLLFYRISTQKEEYGYMFFYLSRLNKWNRIKISFKAVKFICKESEKGLCQNI